MALTDNGSINDQHTASESSWIDTLRKRKVRTIEDFTVFILRVPEKKIEENRP
jgi:hypothetical protein